MSVTVSAQCQRIDVRRLQNDSAISAPSGCFGLFALGAAALCEVLDPPPISNLTSLQIFVNIAQSPPPTTQAAMSLNSVSAALIWRYHFLRSARHGGSSSSTTAITAPPLRFYHTHPPVTPTAHNDDRKTHKNQLIIMSTPTE
ncbi:hypothetical protein M413DRAFT_32939 [Hebeloma cylindrosporum]|uniref:Uncharacterized protein n=1 Tax=Hebeloma cylindrosporum TaxID=76867 RepID=A0A0C3BDJ6_HEBCY|nr:hypothetical protein M413DRAFT_32939 [Hebeloma cylindrosporum h7]